MSLLSLMTLIASIVTIMMVSTSSRLVRVPQGATARAAARRRAD